MDMKIDNLIQPYNDKINNILKFIENLYGS